MGVIDSFLNAVNPERELRQAEIRSRVAALDAQTDALNAKRQVLKSMTGDGVTNSGYSNGGASKGQSWDKEYQSESLSAKSDIEENRKTLRQRSRDLSMNAPLAAGAINSTRTNCIGSGLMPKPKIDYDFLGISKDEAADKERLIKKEFALWAESTLCDSNDQNNFYELQQIAFAEWLKNGEEFVLIKRAKEVDYFPYQLRLKLVEADRVCTPGAIDGDYDGFDKVTKSGNIITNGVEITKEGRVEAYYICSKFPGEYTAGGLKWVRVKKRGDRTGNLNILHIFNGERADQYRGVPFLAPVISTIKQLSRYTEAEIMAAVINSMFSVFVQTENGNDIMDFGGMDDEEEADSEVTLGYGTVNFLKTGESVNTVQSTHPSGNFDSFVGAMANQIGAALEIAPEILLKKFSNNYSASRAAMNETWKSFRMRRAWFVNDFCKEVYELWFNEAVSKGRINAPGYFENPLIRRAWTNATWNGPAQGSLDPTKEVQAATLRIESGLSTHEDECVAINGSDFADNVRTLENEYTLLSAAAGEENGDKQE